MAQFSGEPTILSNLAIDVVRALETYGRDGIAAITEAGIDYVAAAKPDARIPARQWRALLRIAVDQSGDPSFGVTLARVLQPADLHGLGLGWLASESLHDALNRLVRFHRALNTNAEIGLEETSDELTVVVRVKHPHFGYEVVNQVYSYFMGMIVGMCRMTLAKELHPTLATFPYAAPENIDAYSAPFQAPLRFNAERATLVFDRELVDTLLPTSNPQLARINDQVVQEYLARFDRQDIVTRVRTRLIELLPDGRPEQEQVARDLNMSLRNLQRRLRDEDTTFSKQLSDVQSTLAEQYLSENIHPISQVAYLLGYSEPTNFSRSFRQWTGKTPQDFRDLSIGGVT